MAEKNSFHIHQTAARNDADSVRNSIEQQLTHLQHLNVNWDSYDGIPPSEIAINEARRMLKAIVTALPLKSDRAPLPLVIAPTSDGGILLEWTAERAGIEVEISGAGRLSYLRTTRNADGEQYDEHEDVTITEIARLVTSTIAS